MNNTKKYIELKNAVKYYLYHPNGVTLINGKNQALGKLEKLIYKSN